MTAVGSRGKPERDPSRTRERFAVSLVQPEPRVPMAEPVSQLVASMPRTRLIGLMTLFLGPAVVIYSLFSIYPLIATMAFATYQSDQTGAISFAGLANFVTLLTDAVWSKPFWNAAYNNLIFFAVHMLVQNPIGIALAGLLSLPQLKLKGVYRTIIFLPTMLSVVIVGFSWQLILSPLWGVAEGLLKSVGLGSWFEPWLGLPKTALVTLSLMSVWQFVGIPMMLIYAALLNIPDELVDAGRVDGLGHLRIFLHIKLPLVLPTIGMVSILTFVANFNAFDLIYSVKGALAGPNFSADILGTFFYRTFFGNQLQVGDPNMGAAVATVMFFIILVGVCLYLFVVQRRLRRYSF
jgi:raffinose/stachyose/melibiose transport system permease protein